MTQNRPRALRLRCHSVGQWGAEESFLKVSHGIRDQFTESNGCPCSPVLHHAAFLLGCCRSGAHIFPLGRIVLPTTHPNHLSIMTVGKCYIFIYRKAMHDHLCFCLEGRGISRLNPCRFRNAVSN